jgi:iron(III) transport system substrate-binding protein
MRIPKTHKAYAAMFAAALVIATGCSDPEARTADSSGAASASAAPDAVVGSLDEVCAAAQKEGELVSWNSEDPEAYEKIFGEFEKTYPGIKLTSVEVRPDDLVQKMVTESAAGHPSGVDAISITMDKAGPLLDNHLLNGDIDFTKMGVDANHIGDGNTVRTERIAIGLAYNTDQVADADLPTTWDQLVDSKWSGKVVVDPRGDPLQLLAIVWGEDKTVDFVTRLSQTDKPQIVQGATAGLLTVASGENKITTNGRSAETAEQQAKGAPVKIKYLDVVPAVDYYTAVPAAAPHPNAGACWAAWLNSDAGRKAKQEYAFKGNVDLPQEAAGGQLAAIDEPQESTLVANTAEKISAVWAGRT